MLLSTAFRDEPAGNGGSAADDHELVACVRTGTADVAREALSAIFFSGRYRRALAPSVACAA
jgi:hypothetical protein